MIKRLLFLIFYFVLDIIKIHPLCQTLGYFISVRERGTKWDNIDAIIQTIIRQLQLSGYEPGATQGSVAKELGITGAQLKTWRLEIEVWLT